MKKRGLFTLLIVLTSAMPSHAAIPIQSLGATASAPTADSFTSWGRPGNGLQAAIAGPTIAAFDASLYFVALRNVTRRSIFLCGIPWPTLLLTSKAGSTIPPTTTPVRSVFSPMSQTLEVLPNEEWVDPYPMSPNASYQFLPHEVSGARYELEVHIGGRNLSSCLHAESVVVRSEPIKIELPVDP